MSPHFARKTSGGLTQGLLVVRDYLKSPPTYRQGEKSPSIPLLRKGENGLMGGQLKALLA